MDFFVVVIFFPSKHKTKQKAITLRHTLFPSCESGYGPQFTSEAPQRLAASPLLGSQRPGRAALCGVQKCSFHELHGHRSRPCLEVGTGVLLERPPQGYPGSGMDSPPPQGYHLPQRTAGAEADKPVPRWPCTGWQSYLGAKETSLLPPFPSLLGQQQLLVPSSLLAIHFTADRLHHVRRRRFLPWLFQHVRKGLWVKTSSMMCQLEGSPSAFQAVFCEAYC